MPIIKYHLFPIFLVFAFLFSSNFFLKDINFENKQIIRGVQSDSIRFQANYAEGIAGEINFISALRNKNSICLLGSSEFGNDKIRYYPHDFLKDSMKMNVFSFGHAFHQCFSMYCQLLANQADLKNANICIVLSPGWFITNGTNIEAFLEFVPENYLKRIINSPLITKPEILRIAKYINKNFDLINEPSSSLIYLDRLYEYRNYAYLEKFNEVYKNKINDVQYDLKLMPISTPVKSSNTLIRRKLKLKFLSEIKSNSIFVNDDYYYQHLSTKEKPYKQTLIESKLFLNRTELKDFHLLLDLLKKNNCKASFIFQPLNNYHYKGIEKFKQTKHEILSMLKKYGYPVLDMFTLNRNEFEPGILNDVMHTGDYGWTKINQFIYQTYLNALSK